MEFSQEIHIPVKYGRRAILTSFVTGLVFGVCVMYAISWFEARREVPQTAEIQKEDVGQPTLPGTLPGDLPHILSDSGTDNLGRVLMKTDISFDEFTSDGEGPSFRADDLFFTVSGISLYELETPVGISPVFEVEGYDDLISMPSGKDIVALSLKIENLGNAMYYLSSADPGLRLIIDDDSFGPFMRPSGTILARDTWTGSYLFAIPKGTTTVRLPIGLSPENPSAIYDIDLFLGAAKKVR